MHEPIYSLETYNRMSSLGKLRCQWDSEWSLEEELLPLSVRRTQKPQQREEQRASFYEFDFCEGGSLDDVSLHFSPSYLYLVWNTSYWNHFLRRHSCVRFYQNIHLMLDICLSTHFITHDQGSSTSIEIF